MDGGIALDGRWRVGGEGIGRGDVRASRKFCKGEAERERGCDSEDCTGLLSSLWPNQRKTGCGDLWGDCCEVGGRAGMSFGVRGLSLVPKRRVVARLAPTLFEVYICGCGRCFLVDEGE